jgi:3D (Asp-Asp-Asp) domain-containing protein
MGGIRSNWRLMTRTQKILSAATFCCLIGAPSMFATSINGDCGTELYNGAGTLVIGNNPTVCPTGTTLGLNIGSGVGQVTVTGIEVWVSADYTGGTSTNNAIQVIFTPSATAGTFATTNVTCTASGSPGASNYTGGNNCGLYSGNMQAPGTFMNALGGLSGATLQIIAGSGTISVSEAASVTQGSVTGFSGIAVIEYDYTVNQGGGGVPEPTTFVLMGAGLGLLGMLRRKTARR